MLMSRESHRFMSPHVRLQFAGVWDALTFVLNGIVFILIGLQLPFVLRQLAGIGLWKLVRDGVVFSIAIILLRLFWLFGEGYVTYAYRRLRRGAHALRPRPRELLVLGWGGMRGVLSLAAAFSLPYARVNGAPFEQRSMIVYLTFCLIVATLVLQGLSMPWLIRLLAIENTGEEEREERMVRRTLLEEATRYLHRHSVRERFEPAVVRELLSIYQQRLQVLPTEETMQAEDFSRGQRDALLLEVLRVERESLFRLRGENAVSDDGVRAIQRDLDLLESHVHTGAADKILTRP
jgi:CPA1 family monovalent cation:H+ antiporter